jgi:hypothetical protein
MRLAIVCLLFALAPSLAAAGASCPENSVTSGGGFDAIMFSGNDPTGTFGATGLVPWSKGSPCLSGCYDLPNGALAARGGSNTQGGGFGAVHASDVYQIVGPAGAPLTFEAVLILQANVDPYTGFLGSIQSGAQSSSCGTAPACEAAITLSHAPGESFLLSADLSASGFNGVYPEGWATVTGEIRFRGLPAGYSVVSCQNYDVPTPAHPTSWGGVKALYR